MSKTIHIGNKRFPADQVPDKYKKFLAPPEDTTAAPAKAGKIVEIAKATPAKPVKSGD